MKERPILFSSSMVCAIRERRKRQTRRVVVPTMTPPRVAPLRMEIEGEQETDDHGLPCWAGYHPEYPGEAKWFSCPYGGVGDRLWVRETWRADYEHGENTRGAIPPLVEYRADTGSHGPADGSADTESGHWKPSIHMPRWASRITLKVTSVRAEPLHAITPRDVVAEGLYHEPGEWGPDEAYDHLIKAFAYFWDQINAKRGYGWDTNPWVWVVGFELIEGAT
jgi:hypothetical protein